MTWRGTQQASRDRLAMQYGTEEVEQYESWIRLLTREDDEACLMDIASEFQFQAGMSVLDVGAGTGAMCKVLSLVPGLAITALEPLKRMADKLRSKPELKEVQVMEGFSDSEEDRSRFATGSFDAIVARQLTNGLFDPMAAFRNWYHWLKPGASVIVVEGLYDRSAWIGSLQTEVDVLPLSACRSMAMIPYLMELSGFEIRAVKPMQRTNARPSTRTERYLVVAKKPS